MKARSTDDLVWLIGETKRILGKLKDHSAWLDAYTYVLNLESPLDFDPRKIIAESQSALSQAEKAVASHKQSAINEQYCHMSHCLHDLDMKVGEFNSIVIDVEDIYGAGSAELFLRAKDELSKFSERRPAYDELEYRRIARQEYGKGNKF